jgi:hypothetical protein
MESQILAVITLEKDKIGGGAPIFAVETHDELQLVAFTLEKILNGMVHQITAQTLIIIKHR